ncbi:hypothetical protein [Stackebrandtia soli]|uniref:hypothetical protein n=1 Tax=Stackebrandtia soli TaxID=1892856 RepID=UPI0039E9888D
MIERAKAASKRAEDSPKKDVDDVAEPTPPKKPDDKPDKPKHEPANTDKAACNSFTAAAKVVMADGTAKPIADVVVGDEVLSSDPATGEVSTQLVTALPRTGDETHKVDRVMVDVTVDVDGDGKGDEVIESTAGHAFWTNLTEPGNDGAKWVPARDLVSGA